MKRALNICWIAALLSGTALWIQAAESVGTKGAIRGEPIRPLRPAMTNELGSSPRLMVITTNLAPILTNRGPMLLTLAPPAPAPITTNAAGFIELGFDTLGGFPYEITNVPSADGGRELTKPMNEIPPDIKKWNGKKIAITGFVMPMRMKEGRIIDFLLVRDQASCCFGGAPQINHWIRVKVKGEGIDADYEPQVVSGTLRVGEKYEKGYLTGIYEIDADTVHVAPDFPR